MIEEEIKLKVITPLFMSGADSNEAELRAPSIKGVMRYFYRAVIAEENLRKLREEEISLFGGIIGDKSLKSPVELNILIYMLQMGKYYPLPHKKNFKQKCFFPGSTFSLLLSTSSLYKYKLNKFLKIFYLTLLIGGFGRRSRRGFGSLSYKEFSNVNNFKKELKKLFYDFNGTIINWDESINDTYSEARIHNDKNYNYPVIRKIFVSKRSFKTWKKAVESVGEATHKRDDAGDMGYISKTGRLASPVIVSVKQINGEYYIVASIMSDLDKSIYEKFLSNIFKEEINEQ